MGKSKNTRKKRADAAEPLAWFRLVDVVGFWGADVQAGPEKRAQRPAPVSQ